MHELCSCIPSKLTITSEVTLCAQRTWSRLIASYNAAWRPTLAERKSATFGAKDLSCHETSARIFSHLYALLTHLPLVSSFRRSFSSSASNAFSRQLLPKKLSSAHKRDLSVSAHRILYAAWQRPTLAERKSDYHRR